MRTLIAALTFFYLVGVSASISKKEILSLTSQGEADAKICNKLFEDIKALDKKFETSRIFPEKKVALKAMKMLEGFKGTPKSTQTLMDRLASTKDKTLDYKWLGDTMNKTLVCDPEAYNMILTKVVRSSRTYKFSIREKREMATMVLSQLQREAEFPTHLGLLAPYILILDALVDQGAVKMTARASLKRQELNKLIKEGLVSLQRKDFSVKAKANDRVFQTRNFLAEVRENEKVRIKFLEFVETL